MNVELELLKIIRILAPAIPSESCIGLETPLAKGGLELDSVGVFELLVACDEHFGIRIPEPIFEQELTIGRLAGAISSELARRDEKV